MNYHTLHSGLDCACISCVAQAVHKEIYNLTVSTSNMHGDIQHQHRKDMLSLCEC